MFPDTARAALLGQLTALAVDVQALPDVRQVSVYRAVLVPPVPAAAQDVLRPARFDVAVLIETASPDLLAAVRDAPQVARIFAALQAASSNVHVLAVRCARYLGPVERTRQGLFLFNHFTALSDEVDVELATALWEHLAAWYAAETGLTNSTLLAPAGGSDYLFVNHARWDIGLPRLAVAQFAQRTFRSYVLANLRANQIVARPVLDRLAWPIANQRRAS